MSVEKHGYTVTAADFNGETFDGAPLQATDHKASIKLGSFLVSGDIELQHNDTDYAVWKVKTAEGIIVAYPGDFINVADDNTLSVDIHEENKERQQG